MVPLIREATGCGHWMWSSVKPLDVVISLIEETGPEDRPVELIEATPVEPK